MTKVITSIENSPLVLQLHPAMEMTEYQFFKFCHLNRGLRIERTAEGKLIIMPPTGPGTKNRNFKLSQQLANWADTDGTGLVLIPTLSLHYLTVQCFPLTLLGLI